MQKKYETGRQHVDDSVGGYPRGDDLLLIRAAFLEGEAAVRNWLDWAARHDLEKEMTLDHYRLLPSIFERLSNEPAAAGLELPAGLAGAYKKTFFLNSILLNRLVKTGQFLKDHGIPFLLLKGMAMITSLYPKLGSRFQFDFDLLIPFDQKDRVVSLLEATGARPWFEGGRAFHLGHSHAVGFTLPDMPKYGSFDIHWYPMAMHKHHRSNDLFFQDRQTVRFKGQSFDVPPPELLMIQSILHGLRRDHSSYTQWVCDVLSIMKNCPELDWKKVMRYAEELQAGYFLQRALYFIHRQVGIPLPPDAVVGLDTLRISRIEPYLFSYFNAEKRGFADLVCWKLHESRQLNPDRSLSWHLIQLIRFWRINRSDLGPFGFAVLLINRLVHLMRNSVPDYPGRVPVQPPK